MLIVFYNCSNSYCCKWPVSLTAKQQLLEGHELFVTLELSTKLYKVMFYCAHAGRFSMCVAWAVIYCMLVNVLLNL